MSFTRPHVEPPAAAPGPPSAHPPGELPRAVFRQQVLREVGPILALLVVLLLVGSFSSQLWIDVANLVLIAAIAAIGLDLLLGHTGLISVGNAAFLAIGAFTVAYLNRIWEGVPFVVAILVSGVVCALVGAVVALPSVRITGLYLAISTLAFHFVAIWGLREIQTNDVGDSGFTIPVATIAGKEILDLRTWFVVLAVALVIVVLLYRGFLSRKPGRILHTIRERPSLALMSGISVSNSKFMVFAVSSFLVGVAGGLSAYYVGQVSYANFGSLGLAIEYLAMVIIGGLGSTYGAVLGAAFIISLPHLVENARTSFGLTNVIDGTQIFLVQGAVVGLIVAAVVIFQPRGLVGIGQSLAQRLPGTRKEVAR